MKFILFLLLFVTISIVNAQTSILDTLDVLSELDGVIVFNRAQTQIIAYQNADYYIGDVYDAWIETMCANHAYLSYSTPQIITGYHLYSAMLNYFIVFMVGNNFISNGYPKFDYPWGVLEPPMLIDHIDYGNSLTWEDIHPIILGIPAILVDSLTGGWQTHDVTNWMLSDIENNRIYSQYRIRLLNDSDWDGMDDLILISDNTAYRPYITVEYMPDSTSVSDDNIIPQIRDVRIYPNPFRQSTTISFELQKQEKIILTVYNAKGQLVRKLAEGFYAKGTHTFEWDAKDSYGNQVKAGLYIYKITSQYSSQTGKCLLIK